MVGVIVVVVFREAVCLPKWGAEAPRWNAARLGSLWSHCSWLLNNDAWATDEFSGERIDCNNYTVNLKSWQFKRLLWIFSTPIASSFKNFLLVKWFWSILLLINLRWADFFLTSKIGFDVWEFFFRFVKANKRTKSFNLFAHIIMPIKYQSWKAVSFTVSYIFSQKSLPRKIFGTQWYQPPKADKSGLKYDYWV